MVGVTVGDTVGKLLGSLEGIIDGIVDGIVDGSVEGYKLGKPLGSLDGSIDHFNKCTIQTSNLYIKSDIKIMLVLIVHVTASRAKLIFHNIQQHSRICTPASGRKITKTKKQEIVQNV